MKIPPLRRSQPLLLALLAACAPAVHAPETRTVGPTEAAIAHLDSATLHDHVRFLASDEMRGRDTPSPELERAAEYIAGHFAEHGLESAGDDGSFIHRWTYREVRFDRDAARLSLIAGGEEMEWQYAQDFFTIPSAAGSARGEPLYVGTLAEAAAGLPDGVAGRIVLVYMDTPPGMEILQAGERAAAAGAAGLVMVLNPGFPAPAIRQLAEAVEGGGAGVVPLPIAGLGYQAARSLFSSAGGDLEEVVGTPQREGGSPLTLPGVEVRMAVPSEVAEHRPPNVAGLVRGSDPELSREYLVLTAHFDHVGVGAPDASGDSIYRGADDNASGTAMLMQLAAAFAALPEPPARSLLFLAVSGEEKGLLGSMAWVAEPTVPLENVIANINMDMVGRNHPDSVVVVGKPYTTLGEVAEGVARDFPELRLVLADDPDPSEMVFFRSDQLSFAQAGIPAIFFTTWLHDDYHLPSDTPDLILAEKMERLSRLVFHLSRRVADAPERPRWTAEGEAVLEMLR
jgi:hypothetical protein